MSSNVKVRFAPSPTGYLHIGGARTALFNWLFARHNNGIFLLRIEDTDQQRSTEEATQAILDSMKWLGLDWDEGPYYQSQRLSIYKQYAENLVTQGKAFYDTDAEGRKAIRFKMEDGVTEFNDLIHGAITFDTALIEDFVILKADGFPTYNFACVVDDADMEITHIIRGDDHISNTPKQIALYNAFGFKLPEFAHIPMILGEDGSRLSKRHGATSVTEYRDKGYLPHALVNFLALLGWSPGNDQEILSIQEMIEKFSLKRANKTSAQFNNTKLDWMNGQYIKNTSVEQLTLEVKGFFEKSGIDMEKIPAGWLTNLVKLYHERFKTFQDLFNQTRFFFVDTVEYNQAAVDKFLKKEGISDLLKEVYSAITLIDNFVKQSLEDCLRTLTAKIDIGFSKVAQPLRVAITGQSVSAGIFETMELLGKEKTLKRLKYTIKNLCETSEAIKLGAREHMQISLCPYERQALEALERSFALERELVIGFAQSLNELARLFEEIACGHEKQFKAGRVVIMGLVNHTHHLLNGGMQALHVGNGPVWSTCVRGLMETYGACVLISERPGTAPNHLEHIKAGKLRAAAERCCPGLKNDIYRLDQIVHPVSGAIYAGFKPISVETNFACAQFGLRTPAVDEAREAITVLANVAAMIVEKLKELAVRSEVLSAGKLVMVRSDDQSART